MEKVVKTSAIYQIEDAIKPEALEAIRKTTRKMNSLRSALAGQMSVHASLVLTPLIVNLKPQKRFGF
ncbi:hypothetical protein Kalk_17700 [Ketobacter alkanivorans]|uniref:Uncharacterized protein n=1 Tax=Ketobacter alkanivorans TaxID=1917421 RepID=A0A2K9LP61_9GAMM|nr:hypothetical protein Kalk_17700 [Ketobacter alkanivorans]